MTLKCQKPHFCQNRENRQKRPKKGSFCQNPIFITFQKVQDPGIPRNVTFWTPFWQVRERPGLFRRARSVYLARWWKRGSKKGSKNGSFWGVAEPSKMMKFPCFWSKLHVFETPDPKMTHFGTPFGQVREIPGLFRRARSGYLARGSKKGSKKGVKKGVKMTLFGPLFYRGWEMVK